jgi:dTDP-4-dehydrorhamnose 3,5-epimerase-like enzyme
MTSLGNKNRVELAQIQGSFTITYPGTIKAIHYHAEQTDLRAPVSGMLQVFRFDLRRKPRTFRDITQFMPANFALGKY